MGDITLSIEEGGVAHEALKVNVTVEVRAPALY